MEHPQELVQKLSAWVGGLGIERHGDEGEQHHSKQEPHGA